ncbi:MAG: ROK family protein [Deltaproteobacteria bacterium]|nr:ROK family protein [Deltaproteobacteria bacterium]
MTTERYAIGIDLGGTNLKIGTVGETGLTAFRQTSLRERTVDEVMNLVEREARSFAQQTTGTCVGVGFGVPGIVDVKQGVLVRAPNLPGWQDVAVQQLLAEKLQQRVEVDNDANFAALGEASFGAGRDIPNFVMLTLGTGIGGGIILNGKVWHGDRGFAGEVGHTVIEIDGATCTCGGRGCWDEYGASRAFRYLVPKLSPDGQKVFRQWAGVESVTPEDIAKLADRGDAIALKLWQMYGRVLGIGIHNLINVLGVTTFVIGGGIAAAFNHFVEAARSEVASRSYPANTQGLKILKATLGPQAGVIGAGYKLL